MQLLSVCTSMGFITSKFLRQWDHLNPFFIFVHTGELPVILVTLTHHRCHSGINLHVIRHGLIIHNLDVVGVPVDVERNPE